MERSEGAVREYCRVSCDDNYLCTDLPGYWRARACDNDYRGNVSPRADRHACEHARGDREWGDYYVVVGLCSRGHLQRDERMEWSESTRRIAGDLTRDDDGVRT